MDYLYKKFAKYYDLCYSDKDYGKETVFLETLIKKNNIKGKSVLEVGCGTGNHAIYLEKRGFKITGVDLNREMLSVARIKSKKSKFLQGDMRFFDLNEKFDVVLCLFSTMHYNINISDLKKTLKNFHKHLWKGGLLIFDMGFNDDKFSEGRAHTGSWSDGRVDLVRFMKSRRVKNRAFLDAAYILFKNNRFYFANETHKLSIFNTRDVKLFCEKVGFDVKLFSGFSFVSWRKNSKKSVVFCCTKK